MNTPARNFGRFEMLGDEAHSMIVLKNCMREKLYFFPVSSLTRSTAMVGPMTNASSPTILSAGARSSLPTSHQFDMTVENQRIEYCLSPQGREVPCCTIAPGVYRLASCLPQGTLFRSNLCPSACCLPVCLPTVASLRQASSLDDDRAWPKCC